MILFRNIYLILAILFLNLGFVFAESYSGESGVDVSVGSVGLINENNSNVAKDYSAGLKGAEILILLIIIGLLYWAFAKRHRFIKKGVVKRK